MEIGIGFLADPQSHSNDFYIFNFTFYFYVKILFLNKNKSNVSIITINQKLGLYSNKTKK